MTREVFGKNSRKLSFSLEAVTNFDSNTNTPITSSLQKYLQEGIGNVKEAAVLRRQILDMIRFLHDEDSSSILVFYIFLTKDRETIERLMDVASALVFADRPHEAKTSMPTSNI